MGRGVAFRRAQHAQHVAAGDLLQIGLRIAPPRQFDEQRGIARHVLHPDGSGRHPVVIAADPDMVDPGHPAQMVDMVGQFGHSRLGLRMRLVPRGQPSRNRIGLANPAVDKLIDNLEPAKTREELDSATRALDRVLRSLHLMVPRWYNPSYFVAYFDQYDHPANLPPYALGETSFWWYDAAKGDALRAAGVLR